MIKLFGKSQIINKDEQLEVHRDGPVVYVDGVAVKNEEKAFIIRCNVQPFGGKDLLLVPELDRQKEWLWLWTENKVGYTVQLNDIVCRLGIEYQVQSVEQWGTFTQNKIVRIDTGAKRN